MANSDSLAATLTMLGWAVGQIPAQTGLPDHGVLLALSGLTR
jgi:hypothetical protein